MICRDLTAALVSFFSTLQCYYVMGNTSQKTMPMHKQQKSRAKPLSNSDQKRRRGKKQGGAPAEDINKDEYDRISDTCPITGSHKDDEDMQDARTHFFHRWVVRHNGTAKHQFYHLCALSRWMEEKIRYMQHPYRFVSPVGNVLTEQDVAEIRNKMQDSGNACTQYMLDRNAQAHAGAIESALERRRQNDAWLEQASAGTIEPVAWLEQASAGPIEPDLDWEVQNNTHTEEPDPDKDRRRLARQHLLREQRSPFQAVIRRRILHLIDAHQQLINGTIDAQEFEQVKESILDISEAGVNKIEQGLEAYRSMVHGLQEPDESDSYYGTYKLASPSRAVKGMNKYRRSFSARRTVTQRGLRLIDLHIQLHSAEISLQEYHDVKAYLLHWSVSRAEKVSALNALAQFTRRVGEQPEPEPDTDDNATDVY